MYDFQEVPYVGPQTAKDLADLGYTTLEQLVGADPEDMYNRLCDIREANIDRCQLYIFRMVVYYANGGRESELLRWWNWKDK